MPILPTLPILPILPVLPTCSLPILPTLPILPVLQISSHTSAAQIYRATGNGLVRNEARYSEFNQVENGEFALVNQKAKPAQPVATVRDVLTLSVRALPLFNPPTLLPSYPPTALPSYRPTFLPSYRPTDSYLPTFLPCTGGGDAAL